MPRHFSILAHLVHLHPPTHALRRAGAAALALSLGACAGPSQALSFTVEAATLQTQVVKSFPKTRSGVTLSDPRLELDGVKKVAVLCAAWRQPELRVHGTVCVEAAPAWNQERATVSLARSQIRRATVGTSTEVPRPVLWALNQAVPALLDGTVVYESKSFVGRFVTDLHVEAGRLRVVF